MLKKGLALVAVVAGVAAAAAGVARAIEWGAPDTTNQYAGVGLAVFYGSDGRPIVRCTGALVSPTVLLTAGHCAGVDASGHVPVRAQVWFGNGYPCTGDVGGTPHAQPGWTGLIDLPNSHDVGVVVLDRPVSLPTYTVAPVGTLDALATKRGTQDTTFTIVGYGAQVEQPTGEVAQRTRYVGNVQLNSLNSSLVDGYDMLVSEAPGAGTGGSGVCSGDSGGPFFLDGRIVAIDSFTIGKYCKGTSGAFRLDTAQAQAFLASYLP